MKIDTEKLRAFFKRTGKVQEVSWDENTFVEGALENENVLKPIKTKTVHPDKRLSFNETFINIHKQLN